MNTWIVTRHPAVIDWLRDEHRVTGKTLEHLDERVIDLCIAPGDTVVGILPIQLISHLCARGVRIGIVVMPQIPRAERGAELSVDAMREYGARLLDVTATTRAWQ